MVPECGRIGVSFGSSKGDVASTWFPTSLILVSSGVATKRGWLFIAFTVFSLFFQLIQSKSTVTCREASLWTSCATSCMRPVKREGVDHGSWYSHFFYWTSHGQCCKTPHLRSVVIDPMWRARRSTVAVVLSWMRGTPPRMQDFSQVWWIRVVTSWNMMRRWTIPWFIRWITTRRWTSKESISLSYVPDPWRCSEARGSEVRRFAVCREWEVRQFIFI